LNDRPDNDRPDNDRPDEVQVLLERAGRAEAEGRTAEALDAYEAAFEASDRNPALAGPLGRVALRLGLREAAEQLLRLYLQAEPDSVQGRADLAHALREQHRYDEAIELLRQAITAHPEEPGLWTDLGVVRVQQGEPASALDFLGEALRLNPASGRALYYRGQAHADLGDHAGACADYEAALRSLDLDEADHVRIRLAEALSLLGLGELEVGWRLYRARLSPLSGRRERFKVPGAPFNFAAGTIGLEGRSLLLVAEQGLGDEILFAGLIPEVIEALGPAGRLALAVEPRLIPLFARSFPAAEVVAHRTRNVDGAPVRTVPDLTTPVEYWAPFAAPAETLRPTVDRFPQAAGFLKPDPARVNHWRGWLAERPERKVGLLWKSAKLSGERQRLFAPFDAWRPVLRTPAVAFVNLQYGDCAEELAFARAELGVDIVQPPGLDLKDDLDGVAALAAALDLTLGFSNASFNLAGAVGAPAWLIAVDRAWTMLGTDRYPWYPQVRCFTAPDGWPAALEAAAAALAAY
jgi:cytochrome c-type biogenesis protein CcmH/NrfG